MQTVEKILNIFSKYRMATTPSDEFETKGKAHFIDKVNAFVLKNEPVLFSMLGYPYKSMNDRDKVIGKIPDRGELESLINFAHFADDVQAVYQPGLRFSFIQDGFMFNDVQGIPDHTVALYEEQVRDLSKAMPVTWYGPEDFYAGSKADIREKIMSQFGITSDELERRILFDYNVNQLYRGITLFMKGDLAILDLPSNTQLQKKAKIMARELMFRNEAYSALIRSHFSDHIRLSMHQSNNDGTKFSFQLIPGARLSPWMAALVVKKDGSLTTLHKKDAIAAGHELVNVNGQPYYFQEA